jgi:hypothetical protein
VKIKAGLRLQFRKSTNKTKAFSNNSNRAIFVKGKNHFSVRKEFRAPWVEEAI